MKRQAAPKDVAPCAFCKGPNARKRAIIGYRFTAPFNIWSCRRRECVSWVESLRLVGGCESARPLLVQHASDYP